MELYKKHGANPMGGCYRYLQIPIFFQFMSFNECYSLTKVLVDFLNFHDLAAMDPFFVLPILMGATNVHSTKITPTTVQDEYKRKYSNFYNCFHILLLMVPAGLTLYWFVNNLFTIGQQYVINKTFERKRAEHK